MDKKSLLKFIAKAHKNTYAAPKDIRSKYECKIPILTEHKDYDFVDNNWRYHDSYAGSEWAPGREVVFFRDLPIWCMSYQGRVIENLSREFVEKTFEFLKLALQNFDSNTPFRGPKQFKKGDYEYTFKFIGDYRYFTGREAVKYKGQEVFFQDIMGTLIK
jgi:hypothetical protein